MQRRIVPNLGQVSGFFLFVLGCGHYCGFIRRSLTLTVYVGFVLRTHDLRHLGKSNGTVPLRATGVAGIAMPWL